MSDVLAQLKKIGAQKIHEQTHIAIHHTKAILSESYESMTKIQFFGFVSILEREYEVELDEIRANGEEYYAQDATTQVEQTKVFVTPKKTKSYTSVYLSIGVIVFVVAIFFTLSKTSSVSPTLKTDVVDNQAIDSAKEKINIPETVVEVMDENITVDDNLTTDANLSAGEIIKPEVAVVSSLKIISKIELWLGYMDMQTKEKKQTMFTGEFELDPTKEWLLSLGHGYVDVGVDAEITEFRSKYNIKLLYKDSAIKKITFKEFSVLNKGTKW